MSAVAISMRMPLTYPFQLQLAVVSSTILDLLKRAVYVLVVTSVLVKTVTGQTERACVLQQAVLRHRDYIY